MIRSSDGQQTTDPSDPLTLGLGLALIPLAAPNQATGAGAGTENEVQQQEQELTRLQTLKAILGNSTSYTLSRLPPALNFIATAAILKAMGPDAVTAGSVLSTAYFAPLFIARGPTMVLGPALSAKIAAGDHEAVSSLMQSGYIITVAISVPIMALFASSGKILPFIVHEKIAKNVTQYLLIATAGVTANLMLGTLQQFTLAAKKPRIALISSITTLIMANGFAALLGLYFKMGLQGMAAGYAAAFGINLIALVTYLKLKSEFSPYKIFDFRRLKVKKEDMQKLLAKGSFVSLQQACDPGNLLAISLMMAKLGTMYATAQAPALQLGSIFPTIVTGFSQSLAVMIGGINGKRKKAVESDNVSAANILTNNMKRITTIGSLIGFAGAAVSLAVLAGAAKQLTNLLIHIKPETELKTQEISIHLLQITGLSLLFDSLRISGSGILRGLEEVAVPSLISTLFLNGLGLVAGGLLTLQFHKDSEYLFITRSAALLMAAIVINMRLFFKIRAFYLSTTPAPDPEAAQELAALGDGNSTATAINSPIIYYRRLAAGETEQTTPSQTAGPNP